MKKRMLSGVLAICAAIGWWGALYPQFTLMEGTYRIVSQDGGADDRQCSDTDAMEHRNDNDMLYWSILDADYSQIRFKSRLLTDWREFHESGSQ